MSKSLILVTGATGKTGSAVVRQLLDRRYPVRATVRKRDERADKLGSLGAEVVVAGGAESMSGLPFFLPKMRAGYRLGHAPVVDAMYEDGFVCPLADMLMGETAEKLAQDLGIDREQQDRFAVDSQNKNVMRKNAKCDSSFGRVQPVCGPGNDRSGPIQ